jgi:hypothetical protein
MNIFSFGFFVLLSVCAETVHFYTLYTESHRPLIENWFLPSIQDKVTVHVYYLPQECPTGKYKEEGWKKTTTKKVEIIIDAIKRHKGSWFIYSDVDIQFFQPVAQEIESMLNEYDLVIQQDTPKGSACSGFFGCRANDKMLEVWERVLVCMNKTEHSDQAALNYVLRHCKDLNVRWRLLPEAYFGAGLFTGKYWHPNMLLTVPENIKMHHANWTGGIENKIKQLMLVWRLVQRRIDKRKEPTYSDLCCKMIA